MFFAIVKLCVLLFVLYISIFVIRHIKALSGLKFYQKQGVAVCPGATRFVIGNLGEFAKYRKAKRKSERSLKHLIGWLLDQLPGCE